MRKRDRWIAGGRPAAVTVERGRWQRSAPDAIDHLERLTAALGARLQQGQEIGPEQVRALLAGIDGAAYAVGAANAGLAAILEQDQRA